MAGIFGGANAAVAAERGHAHGSAGAENGEFYGSGRHLLDEIVSRDGGVGIILPAEFARLSQGLRPVACGLGLLCKSGGPPAAGSQDRRTPTPPEWRHLATRLPCSRRCRLGTPRLDV